MLTLFPRIKPNPSAPPASLDLPPVKATAVANATADAEIRIKAAAQQVGTTITAIAATETESSEVPEIVVTTVTESDVYSAFISAMATSGTEPFIVEITAQSADIPASSDTSARHLEASQSSAEMHISEPGEPHVGAAFTLPTGGPAAQIAARQENHSDSPAIVVASANVFDELDVLHEAAESLPAARNGSASPPEISESIEPNVLSKQQQDRMQSASGTPPDADAEPTIEANACDSAVQASEHSQAETPFKVQAQLTNAAEVSSDESSGEPLASDIPAAESSIGAARQLDAVSGSNGETTEVVSASLEEVKEPETGAAPEQRPEQSAAKSSGRTVQANPKPRRAKGTVFGLARVPEAETMEDSCEVDAYASATAQTHLDAIDDTFVAHAQLLLKGRERGRALDVGTGPGQIVIKLGYRLTRWKFVGIDRSAGMIEKARASLAAAGELAGRVDFCVADANALDFPDGTFDLVICNSVLHHVTDPQKLFSEIARVVKPGGAILLRDLRRPSRPGYALHVWKHAKHYKGEMRRLFIASVQSAYTEEELRQTIAASPLRGVRIFRHGKAHIGFERSVAIPAPSKK